MQTHDGQHPVKIVPFTRSLPCPLTPEEKIQRGEESARLGDVVEAKEAELKRHKALAKAQIDELKGRKRQLESELNLGHAMRDIGCEERHIYRTRIVQEVRLDTGAVIGERPMTELELQLEFDTVAEEKRKAPQPEPDDGIVDDDYVDQARAQVTPPPEPPPKLSLPTAKPRRSGGKRKR